MLERRLRVASCDVAAKARQRPVTATVPVGRSLTRFMGTVRLTDQGGPWRAGVDSRIK
jgi:hypothetical protein